MTETELFTKTPKFRRECLHKASTIYHTHLTCTNDPVSHRNERLVMQRWLKVVPDPTYNSFYAYSGENPRLHIKENSPLVPTIDNYAHYFYRRTEYIYIPSSIC